MAVERVQVPRLEGVSQEHFTRHLYPQVRHWRCIEAGSQGVPGPPPRGAPNLFLATRSVGRGRLKMAG